MRKLLIKHSAAAIKNKLTLIYILNCTDILFTYSLLKTGSFYEANIVMRSVVKSPLLIILVKILLPALLLYFVFPYVNENENTSLKLCNLCVSFVLLVYILINMMHIGYVLNLLIL